jgi:hypothetical protein
MRSSPRAETGQTLVEFTILLPLLLIFTLVVLDIGRAIYAYSALYNATREGARYGVINPSNLTTICAKVHDFAIGLNLTCPSDVAIQTVDIDGDGRVDHIDVSSVYRFQPITPFMANIFNSFINNDPTLCPAGPCIPIHSSVMMILEE